MSATISSKKIPFNAAYYRSVDDVIIRETTFDSIRQGETAIQIDACGICGTDVNAIHRGSPDYVQVGHEVAGRVLDADGNVTNRTVVLESSSACGRCGPCRNGHSDLCSSVTSFGWRPYLGLAERMVSPTISVVDYSGMDPAIACLSEPLGVAIDVCEVANLTPYSTVLVSGLGPIGLMALRLAKLAGVQKIYASTFSFEEKRNALALEFGADELLFEDEIPLRERKLDPAPDRILSSAPPPSVAGCVPCAAVGAIIVFIGVGHGETDRITLAANEFHFKKVQLRSSFASPALRTPLALDLLRTKRVDGEKLISHRFPLADVGEAVRVACTDKKNAIKVVVLNS